MRATLKRIILLPFSILHRISPKMTLIILYRIKTGMKLSLRNPIRYNEKIQWIKLYDKNPLMPICADKYLVREYIREKGCCNLLNELLWYGDEPEDIPYEEMPSKFIVKVTHGSGMNLIVRDKDVINKQKVSKLLRKWLKMKFIPAYGEWFYGVNKPRIIIEKFLEDNTQNNLTDYKFFCFNGIPRLIYVDTWRKNRHSINVYDIDFNLIPNASMGYPNDNETVVVEPTILSEMLEYSKVLSSDFLHVRVDFYIVKGKIYFGELTFTKGAGFDSIEPDSLNVQMGKWLNLTDKRGEKREKYINYN